MPPTRPSHPARKTISREAPPKPSLPTRPMEESNVRQMMQKLESLEQGTGHNDATGQNRWMVPYADLLTLLLGLFLVLFTTSQKPTVQQPEQPTPVNTLAVASQQSTNGNNATILASTRQFSQTPQNTHSRDARLTRQLQQKIGKGMAIKGIEVHQQMRGVVISLTDNILFAPGSADLTPSAYKTLNHVISQLHTALGGQARPIRVEGHTDNSPIATSKFPSNWELSTARATTIVRYLIGSHQFQPQLLSAAGYGEFKPLKDNSSIEGKQKNRRVDIVVLRPDVDTEKTSPNPVQNEAQNEPPNLSNPTTPEDRQPE